MKIIVMLFVFTLHVALAGDIYKGQTLYKYILFPLTDIRGDAFTKIHTKAQWESLMAKNAQLFIKTYNIPKDALENSELEDVKAFLIHYAKDSDVVAVCEES